MKIIGLTGGIACGKSGVSKILSESYGFPIIDADLIAHDTILPGAYFSNVISLLSLSLSVPPRSYNLFFAHLIFLLEIASASDYVLDNLSHASLWISSPSVCLSSVCLYACLYACMSVCLYACMPVCLLLSLIKIYIYI